MRRSEKLNSHIHEVIQYERERRNEVAHLLEDGVYSELSDGDKQLTRIVAVSTTVYVSHMAQFKNPMVHLVALNVE